MGSSTRTFEHWSKEWEQARAEPDNDELVLRLWNETPPKACQRDKWEPDFNYRHTHLKSGGPRGEQEVEQELFHRHLFQLVGRDGKARSFVPFYHKMYLANRAPGQRIADLAGLMLDATRLHLIMVEVKKDANDCWYALVENLQQVKMARANRRNMTTFFGSNGRDIGTGGVWGMVLAPRAYFSKYPARLKASLRLMRQLKKSHARIAFAADDALTKNRISIIHSNWA